MSLFANAAGIMPEIVPVLLRGHSGMAAEVPAEVGGIVKMQPGGDGLDRHVRVDEAAFDFGDGLAVYQLLRG